MAKLKEIYHAYDHFRNIVHIEKVDKEVSSDFTCVNCGNELIARKGKVRRHHFSHKHEVDCSYETYLHRLAKSVFYEKYMKCLSDNQPYYIKLPYIKTCNSCMSVPEIQESCDLEDGEELFDITKFYNKIFIEKEYGGFIADILLESDKYNESVMVEFAVTHKCEESKIDSGVRIIEFYISSEDDLELIKNGKLSAFEPNINLFNFKFLFKEESFIKIEECNKSFNTFKVLNNGKAKLTSRTVGEIATTFKLNNYKQFEIIKSTEQIPKLFVKKVKESSYNGIDVKNCFACRFIVPNQNPNVEANLFCKRLKKGIDNSNFGVECDKFWRIEVEHKKGA